MEWADELYSEEAGHLSELFLSGELEAEEYEDAMESLKDSYTAATGRVPREPWETEEDAEASDLSDEV